MESRWSSGVGPVCPSPSFFVDGLIHVRAPATADWVPGDSARVILSGQSINADIVQGPLTVYEGELYGWGGEPNG